MGCASSKRVEAAVVADVYRPPPTSVSVFDINAIEEPWLISACAEGGYAAQPDPEKKPTHVPLPILEKLDSFELAPHSWSEVSKALEDLKPALLNPPALGKASPGGAPLPAAAAFPQDGSKKQGGTPQPPPPPPKKNHSFHTLEELEAKLNSDQKNGSKPIAAAPSPPPLPNPSPSAATSRSSAPSLPEGIRPVSTNNFLLRDREEREKKNAANPEDPSRRWRRNPLEGLPELCPPGGADGVVLYTTTLRGVRRTFEDCERARQLVEAHSMEAGVDERDVSLHGKYLRELRELVGEEPAVPRLFVKGRYVGGVDEIVEMNETGRLRLMLRLVRAEGSGAARRDCRGCGGARFVPCTECGGSCKVVAEDGKSTARCGRCNENGLVQCPHCH